jgi:hypothetical protein
VRAPIQRPSRTALRKLSCSPQFAGSGSLDYLARYVFRIAITNARIVGLDNAGVTFAYRDRKTGRRRTCRLSGDEFMRRFLQHVLPHVNAQKPLAR